MTASVNLPQQYVYLLREREFIKTGEPIFKVGMTTQAHNQRLMQYPKGSLLLFQMICNDCRAAERAVLDLFRCRFTQRKDCGAEYFEGNYRMMMNAMYTTVTSLDCTMSVQISPASVQEEPATDFVQTDAAASISSEAQRPNGPNEQENACDETHTLVSTPSASEMFQHWFTDNFVVFTGEEGQIEREFRTSRAKFDELFGAFPRDVVPKKEFKRLKYSFEFRPSERKHGKIGWWCGFRPKEGVEWMQDAEDPFKTWFEETYEFGADYATTKTSLIAAMRSANMFTNFRDEVKRNNWPFGYDKLKMIHGVRGAWIGFRARGSSESVLSQPWTEPQHIFERILSKFTISNVSTDYVRSSRIQQVIQELNIDMTMRKFGSLAARHKSTHNLHNVKAGNKNIAGTIAAVWFGMYEPTEHEAPRPCADVIDASASLIERWLKSFTMANLDKKIVTMSGTVACEQFTAWCANNGITLGKEITPVKLGVRLSNMHIPGMSKGPRTRHEVTKNYNIAELQRHFKLDDSG